MDVPGPRMSPDTVLAGRYRLEQPLGVGATAAVWRGVDTTLERPVAVKVLRDDVDPELRRRFEREARTIAGLNHPNLVRVLDAGSDRDMPYIVMELVEGRSLHDMLAGGPLHHGDAVVLAGRIAEGLAHVHETGVVHRDVKPTNVVVTAGSQPKLVDFGIARADSATTLTDANSVLGTAMYLSPEQAQGLPVDARSDVYSLGCVLYEMVTGRPPFTGDSAVAVAYQHVHDTPARPSDLRPDVPPALEALVLRSLSKDPASRHANGHELATDLAAVSAWTETASRTAVLTVMPPSEGATAVDVVPSPRRRRGAMWLSAAVIAFVLLAALVAAAGGGGSGTVEVPDLHGRQFDDAAASLGDLGLEVERVDIAHEAPVGEVVGQRPPAGDEAEAGAVVELAVSTGPPPPAEDADDEKDGEEKDDEDGGENGGGDNGRGNRGKGKD